MKFNKTKHFIIITTLAIILIILDQVSKLTAIKYLKGRNPKTVIPRIIEFDFLEGGNKGAAFGMLNNKILFFVVITILAILVIIFIIRNLLLTVEYGINNNYQQIISQKNQCILLCYTLTALLSGAVGNFIDRITRRSVVDFISFKFINFPTYNVADIYVTLSCISIVIICLCKFDNDIFNLVFTFKKPNFNELKSKEENKYVRRFHNRSK